jgi:hypothetical protein
MGKSTVVSVLPFALSEPKPGLFPSHYDVPAAPKGGFSSLIVEDGYHLVLIPLTDDKTPPMKVTDTSEKIAQSIIADYISSCLAISYDPREDGTLAIPGLFWLEGAKYPNQIEKEHSQKINQATRNTMAWFENLVKMADDDWSKTHQYKTITDIQRKACSFLNLEREWNYDVFKNQLTLCWSCKASVHPDAITCSTCRAILNNDLYQKNKERYANA